MSGFVPGEKVLYRTPKQTRIAHVVELGAIGTVKVRKISKTHWMRATELTKYVDQKTEAKKGGLGRPELGSSTASPVKPGDLLYFGSEKGIALEAETEENAIQLSTSWKTHPTPEQSAKDSGERVQPGSGQVESGAALFMRRRIRRAWKRTLQNQSASLFGQSPSEGQGGTPADGQGILDASLPSGAQLDRTEPSPGVREGMVDTGLESQSKARTEIICPHCGKKI